MHLLFLHEHSCCVQLPKGISAIAGHVLCMMSCILPHLCFACCQAAKGVQLLLHMCIHVIKGIQLLLQCAFVLCKSHALLAVKLQGMRFHRPSYVCCLLPSIFSILAHALPRAALFVLSSSTSVASHYVLHILAGCFSAALSSLLC